MKNAIEVLKSRKSIRTYASKPVARSVIEEIVDCARLAPTAMNDQPFAVLVLARPSMCAVEDCCAATENLLIAAAADGLGACWVAGAPQAYAPVVAKAFGAPEDRQLIAIVSFGHPAEDPVVEKRPLADVLHWERFRA
jgi:nitroreductase